MVNDVKRVWLDIVNKSDKKMRPILETIDEQQIHQEDIESELHLDDSQQPPDNSQHLSESDRMLLQKFRAKMNKLEHKLCPVCNERFPSINLVIGK